MELTGNKLSPYFQAVEAVLNTDDQKEFTFTEAGEDSGCVLASEPELKDGEASVKGAFAIFEHLFKDKASDAEKKAMETAKELIGKVYEQAPSAIYSQLKLFEAPEGLNADEAAASLAKVVDEVVVALGDKKFLTGSDAVTADVYLAAVLGMVTCNMVMEKVPETISKYIKHVYHDVPQLKESAAALNKQIELVESSKQVTVTIKLKKDARGLGMALAKSRSGKIFVNRFIPRSDGSKGPAEKEGKVCVKDILIAVDGKEGKDLDELVSLIKAAGDVIELTFLRTVGSELEREIQASLSFNNQQAELRLMMLFKEIDADNSTQISLGELSKTSTLVFRKLGITLPVVKVGDDLEAFYKKIFAECDIDKSEEIDFQEFKSVFLSDKVAQLCHSTRVEEYTHIFAKMDSDGNGHIDKDELEAVCKDKEHIFNVYFPGLVGKMAEAMKLFDTNDDQKIEFDEFVAGAETLFAQKAPKMHALASRSKGLTDLDAALKGFLKDEAAQKKAEEAVAEIKAEVSNEEATKAAELIDNEMMTGEKEDDAVDIEAIKAEVGEPEKPKGGMFGPSQAALDKHKAAMEAAKAEIAAKAKAMEESLAAKKKLREEKEAAAKAALEEQERLALEKEKEEGLKKLEEEKKKRAAKKAQQEKRKADEAAKAKAAKEADAKKAAATDAAGAAAGGDAEAAAPGADGGCCIVM